MDDSSEPTTLREKAYASFTRHLLARDLRPGQFVSQRELVELTGLPLGAIREIVPRLEAEGLIKTVPQRGMQIAHIDINLIREAFQFRLFLEKEAVALVHALNASDAETRPASGASTGDAGARHWHRRATPEMEASADHRLGHARHLHRRARQRRSSPRPIWSIR